ncbi:TPA: hypothetical protein ACU967_002281 [Burkholderia contaminans]|uniref:hypothetical protein n=1 Tax=Burkholderia contaminans TaxID=488447 RepID=UPI000D004820|nr:hypothetical protein [Burkholderia contaminans]HDR9065523.1 hypothetical protein [Burkholderia vietnamiensis]MBM6427962.1 hypothetical protein [Burkholderia contaminans]MCA7876792.1 hypothetical protein [Burkholderia contaminans]MDN8024184.1 hypothetical protein [Burkholderia contaminans]PRG12186.1 hypothetical protein C6Q17_14100 [Burkholderia contaminans]
MSITNSAELLLTNRATLAAFGESIANGPTPASVQLARDNVRHAKRLLAQTEVEHAERRNTTRRIERARASLLAPEAPQ